MTSPTAHDRVTVVNEGGLDWRYRVEVTRLDRTVRIVAARLALPEAERIRTAICDALTFMEPWALRLVDVSAGEMRG